MKYRRLITVILLTFVGVSLGTLIFKRPDQAPAGGKSWYAAVSPQTKVLALYFIGAKRCEACTAIEILARQTLERDYAADMKNGRLRLELVNLDDPQNEHFYQDFQLQARTLTLVRMAEAKPAEHRNLDDVWMLYRDPAGFAKYLHHELDPLLANP